MDINQLSEQGTQKVEQWRDAAGDLAQRAKDRAQDLAGKTGQTIRDAGAGADLYVHQYAWTSIVLVAAMAGVVGYLIGCQDRR